MEQFSILKLIVILLQCSAGWLLLKDKKSGFILSYANQLAQLVRFSLGGVVYQYTAILSFGPNLGHDMADFGILLSPTVSLNIGATDVAPFLSVNLLAIMIMTLLSKREILLNTFSG